MGNKDFYKHSTLIERARNGDQQSMYRLYKLYVHAMYNICIRLVSNQYDAEDILQESFTNAFQKLDSFRGDSSFGAWLKRIVINKSISLLNRKKQEFTDIDDLQIVYNAEEDDELSQIDPKKVHETIKCLPPKARAVFNLYLLEGYKHKEIAEMLGINESTSKSQYQRAKQLLREKLKHEINYEY